MGWVRPDVGGWFAGVERHVRASETNVTAFAQGYRRAGDRTLAVGAGATAGATFLYRTTVHGEFSQRIVGALVASFGYRFLDFGVTDIHQLQPALTWYHSRGDIQARHFSTVNAAANRTSGALMLRTHYALASRLRVGGGLAFGDRIFDIASLPGGSAGSLAQFGQLRIGVTARDAVEVGTVRAREDPAFDYRSFSARYVRSF